MGPQLILIDVGDGAPEQLAKSGVPLPKVQTIIISHLHFDHVGGLFAFLSLRYQVIAPGKLTIYGPPGTAALVERLDAAIAGAARGLNIDARARSTPAESVQVVELHGGDKFKIGDTTVTTVENAHYHLNPSALSADRPLSLAFRFDAGGRSIGFTGDTGPAPVLASFFRKVDLLVSEVADPESAQAMLKIARPDLTPADLAEQQRLMRTEHLPPEDVAKLAAEASVGKLVLTHIAVPPSGVAQVLARIHSVYKGPVVFANDLDTF